MGCPYCRCVGDECGGENFSLPLVNRAVEVFAALSDLYSKDPEVIDIDPLYISQELVMRFYFEENDPPTLTDVGRAQDLIRQVER